MSMQQVAEGQANPEIVINRNSQTLEHQAVYGQRQSAHSGLTWGYYGGRWGDNVAVSDGTLTLSASSINYVVVARATGVISTSTASTNWDNTTDYARVYKITTGASAVSGTPEDHRVTTNGILAGGGGGGGASAAADVSIADAGGYYTGTDVEAALQEVGAALDALPGAGASTSQPGEMMAGFIATPSNKDYKIVVKAAHGGTITETTTISASGTCTATFKINTTALGGTANSVSSTEQSQAHASANTFSAGDDIVITVSSNATCADMSFSIKYTRTLA
jgi:hypothetical protein